VRLRSGFPMSMANSTLGDPAENPARGILPPTTLPADLSQVALPCV
jgi:hypothetical protein